MSGKSAGRVVSRHLEAGLFEAPPAMVADLNRKALAVYCGHIWAEVNEPIAKIQSLKESLNEAKRLGDEFIREFIKSLPSVEKAGDLVEKVQTAYNDWLEIKDINSWGDVSPAEIEKETQAKLAYEAARKKFDDQATHRSGSYSEFRKEWVLPQYGTVGADQLEPVWEKIAVTIRLDRGGAERKFLTRYDLTFLRGGTGMAPTPSLLRKKEDLSWGYDLDALMAELREVAADGPKTWARTIEGIVKSQKVNTKLADLILVRQECMRYARKPKHYKSRAKFLLPIDWSGSRYKDKWELTLPFWEEIGGLHRPGGPLAPYTIILDFKGHARRGGLHNSLKRTIELDVKHRDARTPESLREGMKALRRVGRHELQHYAQDALRFDGYHPGLPGKSIQTPGVKNPWGTRGPETPVDFGKSEGQWSKRVRHEHQDTEFHTNLADDVDRFQTVMRRIPKPYWRIAAGIYTAVLPARSENRTLVQEIADRYGQRVMAIKPGWRFEEFKKNNPAKWRKAVKEFYNEWRRQGVDLHKGVEKAMPLDSAKHLLRDWLSSQSYRYGIDSGDHKRADAGWLLEVYDIENWAERKDSSAWLKPEIGKNRWYVLVTPNRQIRQVKGPGRLPGLPSRW